MNRKTMIAFATTGMALVLGACTSSPMGPPSMGPGEQTFGNAVRHNIAAQTVNPDPVPEAGPPSFDGRRAAIAYDRYQADKVKQPRGLKTSTINLIESGGGSGN